VAIRKTVKKLEDSLRKYDAPDGTVEAMTEMMRHLNDQSAFHNSVSGTTDTAAMRLEIVLRRVQNIAE
jgi:hypothetical protein